MINAESIAVLYCGDRCHWRSGIMEQCYRHALSSFVRAGLEPNRLGANAPGVSKKYGSFKDKRRYLERADFNTVASFDLSRLLAGGCNPGYEFSMYWSIGQITSNSRSQWLVLGILPDALPLGSKWASEDFRKCAEMCRLNYGYRLSQPMKYGPVVYCLGANLFVHDDCRDQEITMNTSWWGHTVRIQQRVFDTGILRDIYPESYLSEPYLSARLGHSRTTLKQWIEADPSTRGTLEPYTDILTKWTPPIEKIPQIREELYRAGRVFYWRFFCPGHGAPWTDAVTPEPLYRPDLSAPWEAPDPIPEIYRADYWKDKDPGLTY